MDPLRIALLTSRSAPGMARLLEDPNRGVTWELSLVVGSETTVAELPLLERASVPVELRPMRLVPAFRNLRAREDYDHELGELLGRVDPDYILLCGYDYILTAPVVARFAGKILAIHDADLSQRERLYAGPHAVRDAIFFGETETRNSVYLVTEKVARGPLFLLGAPHPLAPMAMDARERADAGFLTAYAELHRQWMHASWGATLARTLELLAGGTMKVIGDVVWIDGAPGPCRMGHAPHACHEPEAMLARGIPRSCPFID
jgi:folate-dependent phosphoribosylglycinamide formyltransferase PurN